MMHLDYETYSACDLKRSGSWAYARHPTTRLLWAKWGEEGAVTGWHMGMHPRLLLPAFNAKEIHAWNAAFEYAITMYVVAKLMAAAGVVFAAPRANRWRCVMVTARQCGLPAALGNCAAALGVHEQKDKDGVMLMRRWSFPKADGTQRMPSEDPASFAKYGEYCAQDVRAERSVLHALPVKGLPPSEQATWETDLAINERGVRINVPMVRGAIGVIGRAKRDGRARLIRASAGTITSPGQRDRIIAYCAKHGVVIPDCKKETVAATVMIDGLTKPVANLLGVYETLNVSSVAKYTRIIQALSGDRVCGVHQMNAADTGRWGGRIVQFQNLPRPAQSLGPEVHDLIACGEDGLLDAYGDPLIVLRDALRNAIIASPGHQLAVRDMASIEARVLGWLSGCKGYMEAYRKGLDLYIVTGAVIFNCSYEEILEEYKREGFSMRRFVGKEAVLGLGYSMGLDTFEETVRKKGSKVERSVLDIAVKKYRSGYHEIPTYWKNVEAAAIAAVQGKPTNLGPLRFEMCKGYLTIRLPSGRCLWYPGAKIVMRANKYGGAKPAVRFMTAFGTKWFPSFTYGGRLVENIVQAVARDLLAASLVSLEKGGHRPVLHVHDEIVCDTKTPEKTLDAIKHVLTDGAPAWAKGLPLGCSGFVSDYYRK